MFREVIEYMLVNSKAPGENMTFIELFTNFFTHKDYLPPASEIPGTLFTPLHFVFSGILIALVVFLAIKLSHGSERVMKTTMLALWAIIVVLEIIKIFWEVFGGKEVVFFVQGILPLYPCSIFMYTYPIVLFGKGICKYAASVYVCTLGLLGASINFFYPANILGAYSCISFAGCLTFLNHGTMLLAALILMLRKDVYFTGHDSLPRILSGCIPMLIFSIPVNIVNFTLNADYMFFKCDSFILKPIGDATPDIVTVILMYIFYILLHTAPFLPSYISGRLKAHRVNKKMA